MTCQKGYPAYGSVAPCPLDKHHKCCMGRAVEEGEGEGVGATKDWASLTQRQRRRRRCSPAWDM